MLTTRVTHHEATHQVTLKKGVCGKAARNLYIIDVLTRAEILQRGLENELACPPNACSCVAVIYWRRSYRPLLYPVFSNNNRGLWSGGYTGLESTRVFLRSQ
jgi:hypothetical protein